MMPDSILLTGGDGFVGSAVREAALRFRANVTATSRRPGAADITADILRPATLDAAMRGVSTVIHAAGAAHVFRPTPETNRWMRNTNVEGTRNLVVAARRAGVRHVVIVSSIAALNAGDTYGESKRDGERVAAEEAGDAMTLTILRLTTVYGEGDRGNVLRLIRAVDRNRFVWIGRGDNRKSLIHRTDAGIAIAGAAAAADGGLFNVSAAPVTMREVVRTIAHALGRPVPRVTINARAAAAAVRALTITTLNHPRATTIERSLAKWCSDEVHEGSELWARIGMTPTVTLAEGIAREVAWYRASTGRN
jgi:nucleoside-diphosphate-sugar epimerase